MHTHAHSVTHMLSQPGIKFLKARQGLTTKHGMVQNQLPHLLNTRYAHMLCAKKCKRNDSNF